MLHGTNTDAITSIDTMIDRAIRQVVSDVDLFETKRVETLASAVYDDVYQYAAPADLKLNKLIDIRPQVGRTTADNFSQAYSEEFDTQKAVNNNELTVEYRNGTKVLKINKALTGGIVLHQMNSLTANGTWAATTDATSLAADTDNFITGSASLNFDLSGAGTTGYIENSTFTAVDLSDHEDKSSIFVWVYLPDASDITNLILRWGSDSSNYWHRTVTAPHFGSFGDGWNLMRFDWNDASEVGTGVSSAIDYLRLTITYDGTADTDYRVDNIISTVGAIYEVVYYSDYVLQDASTLAYQEEVDADANIIFLEAQSINGLLWKTAELAAQQVQEQGGSIDVQYFANEYQKWLKRYKGQFKSEAMKAQGNYYKMRATPRSRSAKQLT